MKRTLLVIAALLGLSALLVAFSSIYGGGVAGGSIFGGGVTGGSIFGGSAGTVAGGQFPSIFQSSGGGGAAPAATGQHCKNTGNAASIACTMTVTTGNTVVFVGINWSGGKMGDFDNGGCADDKGNTYRFVDLEDGIGSLKACIATVATTASTVFTWTPPGGSDFVGISVSEYSGLLTAANPTDQIKEARLSQANYSLTTYPTTTASQLVIAYLEIHLTGALTCDGTFTQIDEDETQTNVSFSGCYKVVSSTGTQASTWTNASAAGVAMVLTLSTTTTGFTGSGPIFTGHQCNQPSTASRVAARNCALPVVSGRTVVVWGETLETDIGSATDCVGISDAQGNTYTVVKGVLDGTFGEGVKACSATVSATAVLKVTFTAQVGGTGFVAVGAIEVAGFTVLDQSANSVANGTNAVTGTTGTTTSANELVITMLSLLTPVSATCGSGYTEFSSDAPTDPGTQQYCMCYKQITSTGAQSMTYTSGNSSTGALIATLK